MSVLYAGPTFTMVVAGPADNDDLCALFRDVHLKGDLDVNQERDPDYFALHRLHQGPSIPMVIRDGDGVAQGCGSVISRDGWLDGQLVRTAYLADLRLRPGFRGGKQLVPAFHALLRAARERLGVTILTTVIFDENQRARSVLTGPSAARRGQPLYTPMTPFEMASIQFLRPHRGPRGEVRPATPDDLPALRAFLTSQGQDRLLGEDFSGDLLDRRFATWPGFSLDDFLLAFRHGRVVGCLAPWDTAPVKRTRVLGYHGEMAWMKRLLDVSALVLRHPRLPAPGDCFSFAFLTHFEVEGDDPVVAEDLFRAAYQRLRPLRHQFMAVLIPKGSMLNQALRPFVVQRTAMTLYAVQLPELVETGRSWLTSRPGFEMALS